MSFSNPLPNLGVGALASSSSSTSTASISASGSAPPTATVPGQKPPQSRKHRKLNRSAPQLKRNAACLPCRRRRIKCDAAKPACGSCVRSFQFLARTNPNSERDRAGVQCYYEEDEDGEEDGEGGVGSGFGGLGGYENRTREGSGFGARSGTSDPQATVRKLEAKVEELQRALMDAPAVYNQTPVHPGSNWTGSHSHSHNTLPPILNALPSASTHSSYSDAVPSTTRSAFISELAPGGLQTEKKKPMTRDRDGRTPVSGSGSGSGAQITIQDLQGGMTEIGQNQSQVEGIDGEAGKVGGPFMDLIWPGWPPRLPTPAMMDHLIQVFFNMVPSISRLIHRQTFQARLLLRPTHPDFPHSALLHAICAVSARYSAAVRTCSVESVIQRADAKLWEQKRPGPGGLSLEESIGMEECFGERNMRYAQLECRMEDANGRKLVDLVQAMALICYYCQQHANWISGWMMIAQSVRAAIPLGLMRNDPGPTIGRVLKPGHSLLPPPGGDWDREERRTLMFTVLMFDINASASSGWPNMMMIDELYSKLPCSRTEFEKSGEMQENPQTLRSHDLFKNHPVEDSFIALIKGGILLNRVNKFVRYVKAAEPGEKAYLKSSPEFLQLDDDIRSFIQYFPPSLRDPLKPLTGMHKGIDADLIAAHLLPHVAAIFLHEPFADVKDPTCTSAVRLSTESRACLSTIHLVTSTSLDLSYTLVPITSCNYCFTAARTLLLFYQRSLELQDFASARVLLSELEILKLAFKALGTRFAMGVRHWGMLQIMMDRIHKENGFVPPPDPYDQAVIPEPNMRARAFPTHHPHSMLTTDVALSQNSEPMIEVMDRRRGFVGKSASLNSDSTGRPSPGSLADILGNTDSQTPNSGHGNGQYGILNPNTNGYTVSPLQNHAMPPPPVTTETYPPISNPPITPYSNSNLDPGVNGHTQIPPQSQSQSQVVSGPGPNTGSGTGTGTGIDGHGFDSSAFDRANFNFSAGQNGWNGLGNLNPLDPTTVAPPVPHLHVPIYDPGLRGGEGGYPHHHNQGHLGGQGQSSSSSGHGTGNGHGFPVNESQAGEVGFDWINWLSTANVTMSSEEGMGSM